VIFPIFFGLILGDAAYGLCIIGLALWARKKWGSSEMAKDVTTVAIWCGLSSVLFGVIFGEFLGDLGQRTGVLPFTIGDFRLMPLWDERKHKIDELLAITIVIGFVHILFGLILGIVEAIRLRDKHHLGERLGLLLGLLGITLMAVPIELAGKGIIGGVLIVSAATLLIVFTGPTGPIELISMIANVLSYSRLMALGVAGMVIAELANELPPESLPLPVRALIALPIHLLALGLGLLEPTIHALRLHFVEFLPKFFTGDGRAYQPLTKRGMN
jgi:V/A-type H+-transporting ATPase subunit I